MYSNFWLNRKSYSKRDYFLEKISLDENERSLLESKFLEIVQPEDVLKEDCFFEYYKKIYSIIFSTLISSRANCLTENLYGISYLTMWASVLEKMRPNAVYWKDVRCGPYAKFVDHVDALEKVDQLLEMAPTNWNI